MAPTLLPKLITFDGEARSGKGTVAHFVKKQFEARGIKTMLIDSGQAFRGLVISAERSGVDMNDTAILDQFLGDEFSLENTVRLLKEIYRMSHEERDALLYMKKVSEDSAKVGARPGSQKFVYDLTIKWLRDAREEGYGMIIMDGRALKEVAQDFESRGLCEYELGLYFICDPVVGARRTLGFSDTPYDELSGSEQAEINEFVEQINARNHADKTREVRRLTRPEKAFKIVLPDVPKDMPQDTKMLLINTSAEMTKDVMCQPVMEIIDFLIKK